MRGFFSVLCDGRVFVGPFRNMQHARLFVIEARKESPDRLFEVSRSALTPRKALAVVSD